MAKKKDDLYRKAEFDKKVTKIIDLYVRLKRKDVVIPAIRSATRAALKETNRKVVARTPVKTGSLKAHLKYTTTKSRKELRYHRGDFIGMIGVDHKLGYYAKFLDKGTKHIHATHFITATFKGDEDYIRNKFAEIYFRKLTLKATKLAKAAGMK